jgi:hypothetical protein
VAAFGAAKRVPRRATAAARVAEQQRAPVRGKPTLHPPASTTVQVGEAPDGFGKWINWNDPDEQLALVVFLNAADSLGVMVHNVRATDRIQIVAATGLASFSETTKNKGISAAIGVVAAGGELAATSFGHPEAVPVIDAARQFAQEEFREEKVKTKVRDAFGEDPKSHTMARQEGGVLVCTPSAGGALYSAEADKFWIKPPGNRIDANRPDHVRKFKSFFLRRGMHPQTFKDAGTVVIVPWDWHFTDNAGFYELHLILKRGSGKLPPQPPPVPVE